MCPQWTEKVLCPRLKMKISIEERQFKDSDSKIKGGNECSDSRPLNLKKKEFVNQNCDEATDQPMDGQDVMQ